VLQEALALGKSLPATESRGAYADLDDLAIAYRGAHRTRRDCLLNHLWRHGLTGRPLRNAKHHPLRLPQEHRAEGAEPTRDIAAYYYLCTRPGRPPGLYNAGPLRIVESNGCLG
jgi:hypothetical protein